MQVSYSYQVLKYRRPSSRYIHTWITAIHKVNKITQKLIVEDGLLLNTYLVVLLIILTVHVELLLSTFFHARPDMIACLPEYHEPLDSFTLFHSPCFDHLLRDKLFDCVNILLGTCQQKEGSWIKKSDLITCTEKPTMH